MTAQYFYDKWQHHATDLYEGLIDLDTFSETLSKVGLVRAFSLVDDLIKVYAEWEEYECCEQLKSIKQGLKDGLELV